MKEIFELRILEEYAHLVLSDGEGKRGLLARTVFLDGNDPRIGRIAELDREIHRASGGRLFFGFNIRRRYSKSEMDDAQLFRLIINPASYFEPAGEECGTVYDDAAACGLCGAGAKQVGPLILRAGRIPKKVDVAVTIAGEVIVSRRLGDLFQVSNLDGIELGPVFQREGADLVEAEWYHWIARPPFVEVVPPTRVASSPFDEDADNLYRCANGDNLGLNLVSEASIARTILINATIGAILGGGAEYVSQKYIEKRKEEDMDYGKVKREAAKGAVAGAIGGVAGRVVATGGKIAVAATRPIAGEITAAGVTANTASQMNGDDPGGVLLNTLAGVGAAGVGRILLSRYSGHASKLRPKNNGATLQKNRADVQAARTYGTAVGGAAQTSIEEVTKTACVEGDICQN